MRRLIIMMCMLIVGVLPVSAQERDGYAIALERIQIARAAGATQLDLSGLGLESIPNELWELTQLQTLNLRNNVLSQLPPEIGSFAHLWHLYLDNNSLTTLPSEIGKLTELVSLNLYNNQLSELPPEIGNLTDLTSLQLSGNQLTRLPTTLGELHYVQMPFLEDNPLIFPPAEIVRDSSEAVLDFLRHPQPYPPNGMSMQVVGTVLATLFSLVASAFVILRYYRWRFE